MNRRDVAALITGSVGLAAITMAAALTSAGTTNTPAPDVAIHRTVLLPSHKQPVEEEGTVQPSVLVIPTITIVGEVPRRAADLPRPGKDDARRMAVASP